MNEPTLAEVLEEQLEDETRKRFEILTQISLMLRNVKNALTGISIRVPMGTDLAQDILALDRAVTSALPYIEGSAIEAGKLLVEETEPPAPAVENHQTIH